jgi:hypothetical protein
MLCGKEMSVCRWVSMPCLYDDEPTCIGEDVLGHGNAVEQLLKHRVLLQELIVGDGAVYEGVPVVVVNRVAVSLFCASVSRGVLWETLSAFCIADESLGNIVGRGLVGLWRQPQLAAHQRVTQFLGEAMLAG